MHHIQRTILGELMQGEHLRYAQIKPKGLESNVFAYHLKVLKDSGYVMRTSWGTYGLTTAGKRYVDGLSLTDMRPRLQPKIVILLACRDRLGRWLLMRRKVQPLLGYVGFPYGKLHRGETITEAARRELQDKASIIADLRHAGDGYITMRQGNEPISEVLFHLFTGIIPSDEPASTHPAGELFWSQPDQDWTDPKMMPSMPDLMQLLDESSESRFFVELSYTLPTPDPS